MQACVENTPLPLPESASRPLLEAAPAWTIRVARPVMAGRSELLEELRDVPKAALRQVFGKILGTHLWRHHRMGKSVAAKASSAVATPPTPVVPDSEISYGMLSYLCSEAGETLRERKRLAKSISLTLQYSDGESETAYQLLLQSTNDAKALESAAQSAIRGMRSNAFVSVKLDLTATPVQA